MKALFVSGFLAVQVAILAVCYLGQILKVPSRRKLRSVGIFFCLQICCAFMLAFGGYAETRIGFWSILERMWEQGNYTAPETFIVDGDPGLVLRSSAQAPQFLRPNVSDSRAFRLWQTSARDILRRSLFAWPDIALPQKVTFKVMSEKIVETGIKRTFLTYESFDGTLIPAYLLTPLHPGPHPAMIVLHGHTQGKTEEGISQTAGLVDSYHHNVGLELAKAGYVTLMIEFRGFGYLGARTGTEHNLVAYNALLSGSFYKAVLSKDIKSAVDVLRSFNVVNPERIGITGVSFGGEMAVTYAALDERIKIAVVQGFGGSLGPRKGKFGKDSEQLHLCHLIPNESAYMYQEDLFLLMAPRPVLGIIGDQEMGWSAGFKEIVETAYSGLGSSSSFRLEVWPGGHEYFLAPAIRFVNQHL